MNNKDNGDMKLKKQQLKTHLQTDLNKCDMTWSLFQSALNSYRHDTCLRPYPSMFITENDTKDSAKLRTISNLVPTMVQLERTIETGDYDDSMIDLLHWVLVPSQSSQLIHQTNIDILFNYIVHAQLSVVPDFVYEVVHTAQQEQQWLERKKKCKQHSIYAFHGSRLENFYSILKIGLQHHMSRAETLLFGQGIYLSSELMLSLNYSPYGYGWEKSIHGSSISIVALCEIIDDAEKVKCQDTSNKNRCLSAGSIGGTIPDKYFVVLDSECVRVRYLFVYKQHKCDRNYTNTIGRWCNNHKIAILLILYILLLIFIGKLNNSF